MRHHESYIRTYVDIYKMNIHRTKRPETILWRVEPVSTFFCSWYLTWDRASKQLRLLWAATLR